MKVFVYDKKTNKLLQVLSKVTEVHDLPDKIIYITSEGLECRINKKLFKSTAYQN